MIQVVISTWSLELFWCSLAAFADLAGECLRPPPLFFLIVSSYFRSRCFDVRSVSFGFFEGMFD